MKDDSQEFSVMTWNIYVGTDVDQVLAAQTPEQVPILAAQAFLLLMQTNFPERAAAIAEQIAEFEPHVVGLQEVSLIRTQSPGDAVAGGMTLAEDVLFDYLQILLDALQAKGLDYRVAAKVENVDAEVPMLASQQPLAFTDVRLTDYDVILARSDASISDAQEVNYQTKLKVPSLGLDITRGYAAVMAHVGDQVFRLANTHLEPVSSGEEIQLAQAEQLVQALQDEQVPVIIVGDLNTRPPAANTFSFFEKNDYNDIWMLNSDQSNPDGFTSPHNPDLSNQDIHLKERVDLILVRNAEGVEVNAEVIGDELVDRTASGLWPSDHAGVIATLRIPQS
jgi:endonuclease/exonuclease/phosphatase family metal-dependent hydrolase